MSNVVSLFNDTQKYEEHPVVVLADDDPSIRLMIRHVLESEEFDIVEAADGLEAIKAVENTTPRWSCSMRLCRVSMVSSS